MHQHQHPSTGRSLGRGDTKVKRLVVAMAMATVLTILLLQLQLRKIGKVQFAEPAIIEPVINGTKRGVPRVMSMETNNVPLRTCLLDDVIDITKTQYSPTPAMEKNTWRTYRTNETFCSVRHNYVANNVKLEEVQRNFSRGNFHLMPASVTNGECQLPTTNEAGPRAPFPKNAAILFVGNSHLNQLVTSLLCRYDGVVLKRRGCQGCDFDMLNSTKCWENATEEGNPNFLHAVFANGAQAFFAYNSPIFYIGGADTLIKRIMKMFEWDVLGDVTHVIWHQFNSLYWASFFFNEVCPDMAWVSNETKESDYHLSKLGYRKIPSAVEIIPALEGNGFRGTMLLSRRAHDAASACGREWNVSLVCLDHMRRFDMDKGTPFECALDEFGHQCQPGPIDAVLDWLLPVFSLTM